MTEFTFNLPSGFVSMIGRRHNGDQGVGNVTRAKSWYLMQKLYDDYNKYSKKLKYLLDVEWEEKRIEKHYCDNIFKNAHRRLRSYELKLKSIHKEMFYILTKLDGINAKFSWDVISAEEIYLDFKSKYVDKVKKDALVATGEGDGNG